MFLLLQVGDAIGPLWTVALILFTGALGAWLARQAGLGVLRELQEELQRGLPPAGKLLEAALVLVGGVLLLTPGLLTDATGFALLIPTTRRVIAPRVGAWLKERFVVQSVGAHGGGLNIDLGGPGRPAHPTHEDPSDPPFDHPVV